MARTLWFFLKLGLLVAAAIWLANRPGQVELDWLGYHIETSVGILLLAAFILGVILVLAYRSWHFLWASPKAIGEMRERGRVKRGYKALTQGMVAVAAGDAEEAERQARKADGLLKEPPLTLLLQAQAAQLQGDEGAAKRYFEAMLESEETRFLGLRGLITQSLKAGDEKTALDYARRAHTLRPKTPWLLETLFDLSERNGELEAAERTVKAWHKADPKALPAAEAARKRAVVLVEQALAAERERRQEEALRLAREAHKAAPGLLAGTLLLARLQVENNRLRDAQKTLEKVWKQEPHPEMVALYKRARPGKDALENLKHLDRLIEGWRSHEESRLALAEAALDAKLWGEARRTLNELLAESRKEGEPARPPRERLCWLMARLEESEHGDARKVREWLLRAGQAAPEPGWVCGACGAVAEIWSARCGACHAFDSLSWTPPRRVAAELLSAGEAGAAEPGSLTLPLPQGGGEPGHAVAAEGPTPAAARPPAPAKGPVSGEIIPAESNR